ncbi:MAG: hypothetical protein V4773_25730 [Verrucomicrobiota bacterium]
MKTASVIIFAAAVTGLAAFALSAALGATILFATGFGAIVFSDYTRTSRVLRLPATVALRARVERLGLAA